MKELQGHFLVAAPHQLDPNFVEAVVLVAEHTDRGAFGVVTNCLRDPAERLRRQRRNRPRPSTAKRRLYFGGPVTGPLMAVHREEDLGEFGILPGVFFSGRERNVLAVVRYSRQPYKVFTGYAGWGSGQLDDEVEGGVWRIVSASAEDIFSNSEGLWERLSRQAFHLRLHDLFDPKHLATNPLLN